MMIQLYVKLMPRKLLHIIYRKVECEWCIYNRGMLKYNKFQLLKLNSLNGFPVFIKMYKFNPCLILNCLFILEMYTLISLVSRIPHRIESLMRENMIFVIGNFVADS